MPLVRAKLWLGKGFFCSLTTLMGVFPLLFTLLVCKCNQVNQSGLQSYFANFVRGFIFNANFPSFGWCSFYYETTILGIQKACL